MYGSSKEGENPYYVQYMDGYKLRTQSGRANKEVNKSPIADRYKLMFNKVNEPPLKPSPWWTGSSQEGEKCKVLQ